MFYADSMPHEVEPSHTERHAVTLWYYDRLERVTALDRARDSGGLGAATATQSDSARAEAQALVRLLMVEDGDIAATTAADCSELSHKVARLSPQALAIVAAIVGAPSVAHFQQAAAQLSPHDLVKLRADFNTMR